MSEIIQLYKDSNKTIKVYPKSIASEVYLDEENNIINKFDEINSQLETKANQVDLETQIKRMDSFTRLAEGSTTGDAELIDGRIGNNGVTYTNIGQGIRSQIKNIEDSIYIKEIIDVQFTDGYYISKSGVKLEHYNYKYSNPILLLKGEQIRIITKGENDSISVISKTDRKGTSYTNIASDYGMNKLHEYNYTATEDIYITITLRKDVTNTYYKIKNKYLINQSFDSISSLINKQSNDLTLVTGYYINNNGDIVSDYGGGFQYSNPISLLKNQTIVFTGRGYNTNISLISKYTNGTYKPLVVSTNSNEVTVSYTATEDMKVVLSGSNNASYLFKYYVINDISKLFQSTNYDNENYVIFNSGICIGDSITAGVRSDSSNINKSYPSFLSKLMNCKIENGGQGGITSRGYWDTKLKTYNYKNYDFAIIKLGQNGGLTDTIEADTNYDDFNDYVYTNTGKYCAIIEYIKSINPNIKIYLVPIKNYSSGGIDGLAINEIIKKIADKYNLDYLDIHDNPICNLDDEKYHTSGTNEYYNVHFNTVGYMKLAQVVKYKLMQTVNSDLTKYYDF